MGSFTILLIISTIIACAYTLAVIVWIILAVRKRKRGQKDFKYIPLYENNMPTSDNGNDNRIKKKALTDEGGSKV